MDPFLRLAIHSPLGQHLSCRFPVAANDNKIAGMIAPTDVALRVEQPEKLQKRYRQTRHGKSEIRTEQARFESQTWLRPAD